MKIALVLPYLKAGGTERQASHIVNHLYRKGHDVTVIAIENSKTFESLFDVPVVYLNSKNSYLRLFLNLFLLVRQIKALNPDLIISRAWSANVISSMASYLSFKPWVLFISGAANLSNISVVKRFIHKKCIDNASKVISVSKAAKDNIINSLYVAGDNIVVIHNGVDIENVKTLAERNILLPSTLNKNYLTVVFVGRLIHRKGLDLLIKSIKMVLNNDKSLNLIVVGCGEQKREYEKLVSDYELQEFVYFVGQKLNPYPYMKYADIFVLPSRNEGFPNVLLEAMAIGKPVIAANCETGPNEVLRSNNGILVDSEKIESFYDGLMAYLEDEEKRNNFGRNALKTVQQNFNLNKQLNLIEDQIIDCVK